MSLLNDLAESRIVEAQRRGEFDDLPSAGGPLLLDDDRPIAAEWRMAHRVLRNAGYLPREVSLRKESAELEALIAGLSESGGRRLAQRRLEVLKMTVSVTRGEQSPWVEEAAYRYKLVKRLER